MNRPTQTLSARGKSFTAHRVGKWSVFRKPFACKANCGVDLWRAHRSCCAPWQRPLPLQLRKRRVEKIFANEATGLSNGPYQSILQFAKFSAFVVLQKRGGFGRSSSFGGWVAAAYRHQALHLECQGHDVDRWVKDFGMHCELCSCGRIALGILSFVSSSIGQFFEGIAWVTPHLSKMQHQTQRWWGSRCVTGVFVLWPGW